MGLHGHGVLRGLAELHETSLRRPPRAPSGQRRRSSGRRSHESHGRSQPLPKPEAATSCRLASFKTPSAPQHNSGTWTDKAHLTVLQPCPVLLLTFCDKHELKVNGRCERVQQQGYSPQLECRRLLCCGGCGKSEISKVFWPHVEKSVVRRAFRFARNQDSGAGCALPAAIQSCSDLRRCTSLCSSLLRHQDFVGARLEICCAEFCELACMGMGPFQASPSRTKVEGRLPGEDSTHALRYRFPER